jgi:hypothetical protein
VSTRAEVEASILYALDEASANWATAAEMHNMVESAYRAGWDLLLAKHQDHATVSVDFTIPGATSTWTLLVDAAPAAGQLLRTSFYNLRKLQRKGAVDGKYRAIPSFTLEESGNFYEDIGYMFMSDTITIEPSNDAPGDYRAWYVQQTAALSADVSVLVDPVNGAIRQYTIDVVCKRIRTKDNLSNTDFEKFADELAARITLMGANRNGTARRIPDVRANMAPRFRTRRWL